MNVLLNSNYIVASILLLIAMIFDPFNPNIPLSMRMSWQKSIHLMHFILLIVIISLASLKAYDLI